MTPLMVEPCERIFPVTGEEASGSPLGRAILQLEARPIGLVGRLTGWSLNDQAHVGRLLYFHRRAIESESAGMMEAADFFWQQSTRQLKKLCDNPKHWQNCVRSLGGSMEDADHVLRLLVREVFIDTHLAFRQSYLEREPVADPRSRAYKHSDYARALVGLSDLPEAGRLAILGEASVQQIEAYRAEGDWNEAKAAAADLLQRFPSQTRFQDLLVAVIRGEALAKLPSFNKEVDAAAEAAWLAKPIYALKRLRFDYPHNLAIFGALAELYLRRTDGLAKAKKLADALAEVQAALTYQPGPEWPLAAEAEQRRADLEAEMQQMRVQASAPENERPAISQGRLKALRKEASRGFRLMEAFKRSEEARAVQEDLVAAQARAIWEEIGLPSLERPDRRPLTLFDALSAVLHAPPAEPSGIARAWELVSLDNPDLVALDRDRIGSWLGRQIFGNALVTEPPPALSEAHLPIMKTAESVGGREPFWYWLFSPEQAWLKAACAIALVLAIVASGFAGREFNNRRERSGAYAQMQTARESGNYVAMLDAAERFLAHPVLSRDSRVPEIEELYSEALVRWFNETDPPASESKPRIDHYRKLFGLAAKENHQ
jgi:hypothetical protein